ncbi:MAG: ArsR family transcriptional regulator [Actinomycetota bacterium]|jgi:predicted DNA-binding transcriptional regulator|nr:MAG: ArsR family transcriptional regulator [Actinomycetota bacterium]
MSEAATGEGTRRWTFLTNHAHVLLAIARDPGIRLREIAERVGITERAAQRIVAELEREGYLTRRRSGRRNVYELHTELPLRHPLEERHAVGELLDLLRPVDGAAPRRRPSRR